MIDENIKNAEALSALRSAISEQRDDIDKILDEFHNGFRSDIKSHVTEETKRAIESLYDKIKSMMESEEDKKKRKIHYKKVNDFIDTCKNPKTWLSLIVSFIVGMSVLVGGIATLVYKLPDLFSSKNQENNIVQPISVDSTP